MVRKIGYRLVDEAALLMDITGIVGGQFRIQEALDRVKETEGFVWR